MEVVEANTGVMLVEDRINEIQVLASDRLIMTEAGFLEVFINNEAQTPVYYDNFMVTATTSAVTEVNAYYPFGGIITQLSSSSINKQERNLYKYNGKELQQEFGMNQLDYGARMMEPAVGRWWVPDPLSEKYYGISPYAYCLNNPIRFMYVDYAGLYEKDENYKYEQQIRAFEAFASTKFGRQYLMDRAQKGFTYFGRQSWVFG